MRITREDLIAATPNTSGKVVLDGLDGQIEVFRDVYGIPHVRAQTAGDAFFGQGFVTAQDRLWHMEHDRRWAYGRWAEFAGDSALEQDRLMRRFRLRASVEDDYAAINQETRAMLDTYTAGVNASVLMMDALPIEFQMLDEKPAAWEPMDCLAVFKARHILMGVFESKLWRARLVSVLGSEKAAKALPGYQPGHLTILPPGGEYVGSDDSSLAHVTKDVETISRLSDPYSGSNNWVISGSRTASGKPLVAGDPHRQLDTPNVYYQNHMACPDFDAIGLSFPGFPGFPHFGHNASVAWCVTHASADYQDLYAERFKDGSNSTYEFKGEWKQAEVHREVIEVRDGRSEEIDVVVTHHGPVIAGDPGTGHAIALRFTGTAGPNLGFECLPRMLKAGSVEEMDEAMRDWVEPCHNFVLADVHGNIEYLTRGKLPIRSEANAWFPVAGWTGEHEWEGFVPFEEMPRSRNPDTGYIVTANNRIVGDDYPHYIGLDYSPGFRAKRIHERIKDIKSATVEDMASIHAERVSIPGQKYARLLAGVEPRDELSGEAMKRVTSWDGSMDQDAVEPSIYSAFRWHLNRTLLQHALGPLWDEAQEAGGRGAPQHLKRLEARFLKAAEEKDPSPLPPGADWPSLMAQALSEGIAYLKDRLGDDMDSWTWGKLHFTKPIHKLSHLFKEEASLLDPPSVPTGGDGDTPQAGSYTTEEPFTSYWISVARYAFDLSDWSNSRWVVPLGVSGHPGSPHYADQTSVWEQVQMVPMLYDWARIEDVG